MATGHQCRSQCTARRKRHTALATSRTSTEDWCTYLFMSSAARCRTDDFNHFIGLVHFATRGNSIEQVVSFTWSEPRRHRNTSSFSMPCLIMCYLNSVTESWKHTVRCVCSSLCICVRYPLCVCARELLCRPDSCSSYLRSSLEQLLEVEMVDWFKCHVLFLSMRCGLCNRYTRGCIPLPTW